MQTWPAPPVPALPGRGQPVRVLDTTTGTLTVAAEGPVALLYVCGITPYDATHLGHAATYIAFDLLHRAWLDAGLTVRYTSNVTDVDDPLLERATRDGVDWRTLADDQTALFAEDMEALAVLPPHSYLGVVETIPSVVDAVRRLLQEGTAYPLELEPGAGGDAPDLGDVYADLGPDTSVDGIAGLDPRTAVAVFAERGGDPDRPGKRTPLDPALWRRERPGEPAWDGKGLGSGRPGWHIECAVIAEKTLGPSFDVLGGGRDLAFPHHEMSAVHARSLGGDGPRVRVHAGMVGLHGEKMSKSLGNLVLVSALRRSGVDPMAIRLAVLSHHYRSDWMWDDAVLETAQQRLSRWRAAVARDVGPDAAGTLLALRSALATDLDAPQALRAVDAWVDRALTPDGPVDDGPVDDGQVGGGPVDGAPAEIGRAVDALLGIRL